MSWVMRYMQSKMCRKESCIIQVKPPKPGILIDLENRHEAFKVIEEKLAAAKEGWTLRKEFALWVDFVVFLKIQNRTSWYYGTFYFSHVSFFPPSLRCSNKKTQNNRPKRVSPRRRLTWSEMGRLEFHCCWLSQVVGFLNVEHPLLRWTSLKIQWCGEKTQRLWLFPLATRPTWTCAWKRKRWLRRRWRNRAAVEIWVGHVGFHFFSMILMTISTIEIHPAIVKSPGGPRSGSEKPEICGEGEGTAEPIPGAEAQVCNWKELVGAMKGRYQLYNVTVYTP